MIFHVLNHGNDHRTIFGNDDDYAAFLRLFGQTQESAPMRMLAYCLMPNHWHLVLWPEQDEQLAAFMHRLTTAHVRRRHRYRQSVGCSHV